MPPSLAGVTGDGFGLIVDPGCAGPLLCYKSETALAMAFGGGLDVKATDRVWIRLFQLDYLRANLSLATQSDFRLSAGVVFRFGRR